MSGRTLSALAASTSIRSRETWEIYMRNCVLPAVGRLRIDRIDHARVSAWFDAASAARPGVANREVEILRGLLATACQWSEIGELSGRGGSARLAASKTGPRTVWLGP